MNLIRVLSVFRVNLMIFLRDKGGLFFTFAFPVILMLMFGFIFQDSDRTEYDIYVQDLDGSGSSENLTAAIRSVPAFRFHTLGPEDDPQVYARSNSEFVLVIQEGFGSQLARAMDGNATGPVNLTAIYDPSVSSTQVQMSLLAIALDSFSDRLQNASGLLAFEGSSVVSEDFSFIEFFIPGVIGLTVMSGAVFGTIFGDLEMKQKGIFRKLSTTPITRGEWILSTMLFQLFSAGLSVAVILIVGFLVFGARLHMNPIALLIVIFEAFAFTGLGMLVVRFVKEAQSASALGNAITFPMMFLSGSFFDVDAMPGFLQVIARVLPLYYVNEGLREAMIFDDTMEAAFFLSVIAVFAVIVFVLGVLFTRWRTDQ